MTKLDSILKTIDITLSINVYISQAYGLSLLRNLYVG